MKKCKSCQKEIDNKASKCPFCQTDQRIWFARHPILTVIIAIILIGAISGSSGSKNSTYQPSNSKTNTPETSTATPTPTVAAGKVEVKSEKKKVSSGYTMVVGEVVNNTTQPVEYIKVTATFYDDKNEVVSTGFTFAGDTASTPLEPGNTTPFEVSSYPDKSLVSTYKLDVSWR